MQPGYQQPDATNQQEISRQYHHRQQPQQLMQDGCTSSSLNFTISNSQNLNHPFHLLSPQQIFLQQQQQQQQNCRPITHQLFQHQHQQEFHPFQHQTPPTHPPGFFPFKLGLGESTSNKDDALSQEIASPAHNDQHLRCYRTFIKGSNSAKHWSENGEQESKRFNNLEDNFRPFSELEAICSIAQIADQTNNQAGSGSALTGENSPRNAALSMLVSGTLHGKNVSTIGGGTSTAIGVDHGSENSIGEEASVQKSKKRKRKRNLKEKLSSMTEFFEGLVKQVMDHQEMLHKRFLEVIDRMDKERTEKEQVWRRKEVENYNREAIARAHEQALVSSREAQIVTYIEKITGKSINFPALKTPLLLQPEVLTEPVNKNHELMPIKSENNSRWPNAEVEALIQCRTGIERKFQEPGSKGPLWEEVSSLMASIGYQRSAKRCKEKWENINKYFRKAKESNSTKNRSHLAQSKTCSYFTQLDDLYSRTLIDSPATNIVSMPSNSGEVGFETQGYSELLQAVINGRDLATPTNASCTENIKVAEIGTSGLEFGGIIDDKLEQGSHEGDHESEEQKDAGN